MERMEMAEKIREHAQITIEEAKTVLEQNNWDLLDAMIQLEREGKVTDGVRTGTKREEGPGYEAVVPTVSGKEAERRSRREGKQRVKNAVRTIICSLVDHYLVIKKRDGELLAKVPVLLPVICLIASFWITTAVLFLGMLIGFRYSLEGKAFGNGEFQDNGPLK